MGLNIGNLRQWYRAAFGYFGGPCTRHEVFRKWSPKMLYLGLGAFFLLAAVVFGTINVDLAIAEIHYILNAAIFAGLVLISVGLLAYAATPVWTYGLMLAGVFVLSAIAGGAGRIDPDNAELLKLAWINRTGYGAMAGILGFVLGGVFVWRAYVSDRHSSRVFRGIAPLSIAAFIYWLTPLIAISKITGAGIAESRGGYIASATLAILSLIFLLWYLLSRKAWVICRKSHPDIVYETDAENTIGLAIKEKILAAFKRTTARGSVKSVAKEQTSYEVVEKRATRKKAGMLASILEKKAAYAQRVKEARSQPNEAVVEKGPAYEEDAAEVRDLEIEAVGAPSGPVCPVCKLEATRVSASCPNCGYEGYLLKCDRCEDYVIACTDCGTTNLSKHGRCRSCYVMFSGHDINCPQCKKSYELKKWIKEKKSDS
ncbi:MAG: hypothetical protein CVT48_03520 [Thermoplasmata archaeon HGW-Thermoplasmata-1]|nr:MAG: hypothetical protein CVT48_03520 [Thermoplasmata archaeon HGW-Thermoplasmata-1]